MTDTIRQAAVACDKEIAYWSDREATFAANCTPMRNPAPPVADIIERAMHKLLDAMIKLAIEMGASALTKHRWPTVDDVRKQFDTQIEK